VERLFEELKELVRSLVDVQFLSLNARCLCGETVMSVAIPSPVTIDRAALIREAFRLEYITLAWMTVEACVAIGSGLAVGSLTLMAFGIDSLIELASATVLVWRLNVELRHGQAFAERAERAASRIGGALLFALAVYVLAADAWKLMGAARRGVLVAGSYHHHARHSDHVFSGAAQAASRRRARQPRDADRCCREHHLRLARLGGGSCAVSATHHRCLVGGPFGFTRGLSGSSSAKAARPGRAKIAATTANDI
jgi:hypothetical protein